MSRAIVRLLARHAGTRARRWPIAKAAVFRADIDVRPAFNGVHAEYLDDPNLARSVVGVDLAVDAGVGVDVEVAADLN